jgi:hypothetical protein
MKGNHDSVGKVILPESLNRLLGIGFVSQGQLGSMLGGLGEVTDSLVKSLVKSGKIEPWVAIRCHNCGHLAPAFRNIEEVGPEFECLICDEITPDEYLEFYRVFKVL